MKSFIYITIVMIGGFPISWCKDQPINDVEKMGREWAMIEKNRLTCQKLLNEFKQRNNLDCKPEFDQVLCWPATKAGQTANQSCPEYVSVVVNTEGIVTRSCLSNGKWFVHKLSGLSWSNYSQCVDIPAPTNQSEFINSVEIQEIYENIEEKRLCQIEREKSKTELYSSNISFCIPNWDGRVCWPRTNLGETATKRCPSFFHFQGNGGVMFRKCLKNGEWQMHNITNDSKSDYYKCKDYIEEPTIYEIHGPKLSIILQIGYMISVSTLVLASIILAAMRRLRCPRNNLHLQLFSSFIVRGALSIMKDQIFVKGTMALKWTTIYSKFGTQTWDCKVFIAFWNYSLMANYSWILMEGLYLHNLIFHTMFTDRSNISKYVACGWCLPLPFIVLWSVLRIYVDDELCWTSYGSHRELLWIIRGPTTLFIILNFAFFLRIVRVLFVNLRGSDQQKLDGESYRYTFRGRRYKKLIKSTLILVPLFGAYHIIFVIMSLASRFDKTLEIIWLYSDAICTSLQGFLVAVLYSLINPEVHAEIRRKWHRFKNRQSGAISSKKTAFSNSIQLTVKTRKSTEHHHAQNNFTPQICQKEDTKETRSAQDCF